MNQNHTQNYIWQNSECKDEFKVPTGKRGRIIISHAGSSSFGFVNDSKLLFRCNSDSSKDYHSQMNFLVFKDGFIQMLNNLEKSCVIVMDNASYHSVHVDNYPRSNDKIINVQKWLQEKGVQFSPLETLPELRERVKQLIPQKKKYELDVIALSMGHASTIVSLPIKSRRTYLSAGKRKNRPRKYELQNRGRQKVGS